MKNKITFALSLIIVFGLLIVFSLTDPFGQKKAPSLKTVAPTIGSTEVENDN